MMRGANSSRIAVSSTPSASTTDDTLKTLAADRPSVLASSMDRGAPSASTVTVAAIPTGSGVSRTMAVWLTLSRAATRLAFSDGGVINSDNSWLALGVMDWRIVKSCRATCNRRPSVAYAVDGVTVQEGERGESHTEVRMAEAKTSGVVSEGSDVAPTEYCAVRETVTEEALPVVAVAASVREEVSCNAVRLELALAEMRTEAAAM